MSKCLGRSTGVVLVAAAAFSLGAHSVQAQTAAATSSNAGDTLEEVIVTAERRSEDLQKTAVSVTALSGDELEHRGQYTVQQILQDVPGVTAYVPTAAGGPVASVVPPQNPAVNIVIRGVPSDPQPIVGSTPVSTAYYVDGIYNGIAGDFDVNQIEVLRGPQGTLYGRSATSGVVAVYTHDPVLGRFSGDVLGEIGSFQLHHINADLNLPVGDTLALRVAVNQFDQQGLISEKGTEQKAQELRAKLLYQPSDDLRVLVGYAYRIDHDNSGGATETTAPNQPDKIVATLGQEIFANLTIQRQLWAQVDANVGIGTLTYIPAYHTYSTGGSVSVFLGFIEQKQNISLDKFVTHELRLSSHAESAVKWGVGATYYDNQTAIDINPIWVGSGALVFKRDSDHGTRDIGAFAEATFPLATTWRLTTGLRYDNTKIQVSETAIQNNSNGNTAPDFLSPQNGLPLDLVSGTLGGEAGRLKFSNLTYKARLEKDLTPHNLVYGMTSTGFLPGDVYLQAFGVQIVADRLDQEKLTSYEVGSKNRFLNDRLQINGDVFYYRYEGYQQGAQINPVIPNTFAILTSPAKMLGFELETDLRLTANDMVTFSAGHTKATFVDQPNTPTNPFSQFVAQTTVPGVVPTSFALSYDHTFRIPGGSTVDLYDQVRYSAGYDQTSLNAIELANGAEPYVHVGNQVLDDLNLSWSSSDSRFHVGAYVHNLTNQVYKQSAGIVTGGFLPPYQAGVISSSPRTYGLVVQAAF